MYAARLTQIICIQRGYHIFGEYVETRTKTELHRLGAELVQSWCSLVQYLGGLRYIKLASVLDTPAQARLSGFGVAHTDLGYIIYKLQKSTPSLHELPALR